ncbi:hypothetical protein HDU96_004887 [Phlyctochytrium bullatum]|nr:hypothetical protein HDU96_004887 [Phlyctochytrium bullatum]
MDHHIIAPLDPSPRPPVTTTMPTNHPTLNSLPTELLHRLLLRHLSPLDASRLMITSHPLRTALKHLPLTLARRHLRHHIHTRCLVDPEPTSPPEDPLSPPPQTPTGRRIDWTRVGWDEGVDAVYWAALFVDFGVKMSVVAEAHRNLWTEDQMNHFNWLRACFYRPLSPDMTVSALFHGREMRPAHPLPPLHPRNTTSLLLPPPTGHPPPPTARPTALAHLTLFTPSALPTFLSHLPTPPHKHLPTPLTLLAYLNHPTLLTHLLLHHPPLPHPLGPGSLPHRVAAATNAPQALAVLLAHAAPVDVGAHDAEAIRLAAKHGHVAVLQTLLAHPAAAQARGARDDEALRAAAANGHAECVALLLATRFVDDPSARDNEALRAAAANGHAGVVAVLLDTPGVDPAARESEALRAAAANGRAGVVKALLEHRDAAGAMAVDPAARDFEALRAATANNHAPVVAALLAVPTPTPLLASCLRAAAASGHVSVVALLLPYAPAGPALLAAARHNRVEVVEVVLGAEGLGVEEVGRALRAAAKRGFVGVVKRVLGWRGDGVGGREWRRWVRRWWREVVAGAVGGQGEVGDGMQVDGVVEGMGEGAVGVVEVEMMT